MLARTVITRRGRRFRGYFPSPKLGRMVAWESLLERDAILLLECSQGVVFYREQPTLIEYADGERLGMYYPDFEVTREDGDLLHLEIKTSAELAKPEVGSRFRAIAAHYRRQQRDFRIATEREIRREPLLTNARTLAYVAGRTGKSLPSARVLASQIGYDALPFVEAEAQLGRELVIRLIAGGTLTCDLTLPLAGNTPVAIAMGGHHAAYLL